MKLEVALRHAREIASRLANASGKIDTPNGAHEAMQIEALWLFGSAAKGAENPNDIDLLYKGGTVGQYRNAEIVGHDPAYLRRHGIRVPRSTETLALQELRRGLKMIRFHRLEIDGSIAQPRILLWALPGAAE